MTAQPANVRVRDAEVGDEAAWRSLWRDFVVGGPEPCAEGAADYVWRNVQDSGSPMRLLLAEAGNRAPAGFLLYVTHPYSWSPRLACYLLDLYVVPAARGRRIGQTLIEILAERGRQDGWYKIYWMTQSDNAPAQALYDRLAERSALVRYDLMLNP